MSQFIAPYRQYTGKAIAATAIWCYIQRQGSTNSEVNKMKYSTNIKPISYLKSNTAEVIRNLENDRTPLIITQNGEAKMIIEDVRSYEQKEEQLALLKILLMGEKDAQAGKGMVADEFRKQLAEFQPVEEVM
jgi:PHD/YefM family antitoxin component YafN of YafNO toxin-antitoxin module